MNDMSAVIVPKSDQKNAEDFLAGPQIFTIEDVAIRPGTEQPVSIRLANEDRVWRPCKSMSRVLVAAWGPDAKQYVGRSVKLFCDPNVTWGGMKVGGIRISHMTHIERDMVIALTATKGKKVMATIKPLVMDQRQSGDDPATRWATAYIAAVESVENIEALVAFEAEKMLKLQELKDKRPELHERCVKAAQERGMALSREGKPASDMGEGFTDPATAEDDF